MVFQVQSELELGPPPAVRVLNYKGPLEKPSDVMLFGEEPAIEQLVQVICIKYACAYLYTYLYVYVYMHVNVWVGNTRICISATGPCARGECSRGSVGCLEGLID